MRGNSENKFSGANVFNYIEIWNAPSEMEGKCAAWKANKNALYVK